MDFTFGGSRQAGVVIGVEVRIHILSVMAFSFEVTTDYDLVRKILTQKGVWEQMTGEPIRTEPRLLPQTVQYILVKRTWGTVLGLALILPRNPACFEVHICLMRGFGRSDLWAAVRDFFFWIWFRNPQLNRVIANIPAHNRRALIFAARCGFTRFGVNPKAILARGQLWDEVWVGITRQRNEE